jgi:hypothetical protein
MSCERKQTCILYFISLGLSHTYWSRNTYCVWYRYDTSEVPVIWPYHVMTSYTIGFFHCQFIYSYAAVEDGGLHQSFVLLMLAFLSVYRTVTS